MVYVPKIYWRFSKSKLLVMEWIEGERLTSPQLPEEIKTKLVRAMVQCSLQQMLEKGFFHADPHGGNLLATADGKLVYLDFGMMSQVEAYQVRRQRQEKGGERERGRLGTGRGRE